MSSPPTLQSLSVAPRFQLGLWQFFVLILIAAACLSMGVQWGLLPGIVGVLLLGSISIALWCQKGWLALIPAIFITGYFLCQRVYSGPVPLASKHSLQCQMNLKQLGLALHNYHNDHGHFPPAVVKDKDGAPLYSWRVLLLPYLDQGNLYEQFRRDEPWDSPHNMALVKYMPSEFGCPAKGRASTYVTQYVAITGDETLWPPDKQTKRAQIKDGLSRTLALVEWPESDIVWSQPRDLPMVEIKRWWQVSPQTATRKTQHRQGVSTLKADGSVGFVQPTQLSAPALRAILTRAGGEREKSRTLQIP